MSGVAPVRGGASDGAFRPLTVALMLAVGGMGFIGTLVLGAYAPDWRAGRNGGAHALSNAATGYAGLVRLAGETGRNPRVLRSEEGFDTEDLLVLTPERGAVDLSKALDARQGRPTLVVLPKWATVADDRRSGWVRVAALLPRWEPQGVLAPATRLAVERRRSGGRPLVTRDDHAPAGMRFQAPRPLQTARGAGLEPIVTDGDGRIVLGKMPGRTVYVLADPDLLSNAGVADLQGAGAALAMLDHLNSNEAEGIAFDVTLNGLGRSPSLLKLVFEPPFLAFTLTVAAALLLAGWQALARFGAAVTPARAIAFGKGALLDNSAALVRRARREGRLGGRYADAMRARAAERFGAPAGLSGEALDAYFDRAVAGGRFSGLAADARAADDGPGVLTAARRLHGWLGDRR